MNFKAILSAAFCLVSINLSIAHLVADDSEPSGEPATTDATVFRRDVMPLLSRMGCNSVECHGSFAGQGGLRLSLFAGGPADDYDALVRALRGRRVNRMAPAKSLMLLKATAEIKHGGGNGPATFGVNTLSLSSQFGNSCLHWNRREKQVAL